MTFLPFLPRRPSRGRIVRWRAALLVLAGLVAVPAAVAAVDEKDLLPVDQAFAPSAAAAGPGRVAVAWKIADGYYLYRHRIKVVAVDGGAAGALVLPAGTPHHDDFFGRVETYRKQLRGQLPIVTAPGGRVALKISYQGCADAGVCYPPQTRTLTVDVAAAGAGAASAPNATASAETAPGDAGFAALGSALGQPRAAPFGNVATPGLDALPLAPEQAFAFEAIANGGHALLLRFTPAHGYYLYRDKTRLALEADGIALGAPRWPQGVAHHDEHFGDVVVYFDQVDLPVPLVRSATGAAKATLVATFQGCQTDGICYPPMTRRVTLSIPAGGAGAAAIQPDPAGPVGVDAISAASGPSGNVAVAAEAAVTEKSAAAAPQAEDTRLAAGLAGSGRWLTLFWFFVGGLGLAFTPCVLPMIPILSGLIAGQGTRLGTGRALALSLVYVLANALVFTVAGVIAGLVGANLQAAFQTPWVLIAFSLLFVALALSSFGLYELQLPAAVRARLGGVSDKQRGGSWLGVAAMGALSALIVGPCVAPPLAAAVLYISQSHDPVLGGAALFVLAMGMGVPLLAFGAAAGRGMPTSGPWMTAVQRAFGFVFLALAVWMLSRIVPGAVTLALFGALALAAAAWAFNGTRAEHDGLRWLARFAGLLLAVVGAAQLFGAFSGGHDPLRPLVGGFGGGGPAAQAAPAFRTVKSVADLDRELAAARGAGKPVLFDFYADWCVACKEMERDTFPDPAVRAAFADYVLLKADVTANDAVDQALMQRFGIIGPPATLFFADARERRELRLIGFERADAFAGRLQRGRGGP